jgi:phosphopantothenate---cysteine ligase (ATP)
MDVFQQQNPTDASDVREQLKAFCAPLHKTSSRIAVVTSGGTTIPLEKNCVRFVDNFSSGRRGAISTEELLQVRSTHL